MRGYAGKFLEVDLSSSHIEDTRFSEQNLSHFIGGRGLAAKILWDRLGRRWEEIDPLGPENILLLLAGPLTGYAPGGRLCVSGKSPQCNGIIGSTVAGEFAVNLRCAGYDGVIFAGKAEKPVYLSIKDSEVELKDASRVWEKDGKETLKVLVKEERKQLETRHSSHGLWKDPSAVYIGPAGEKRSRIAAVMAKWAHAAGYGGYGGVMGSKNLKAVLVTGTEPLPTVSNLEKVAEIIEKIVEANSKSTLFRLWGTASAGYDVGARLSSEPIRNWQEEWHNEKHYGVNQFEKLWVKRFWGDFGCPTTCLKLAVVKSGPLKGAITDNPDYENQAYLGTNLGIFKPEENVYLTSLVDDLGLCGIQAGNVLGFAGELYQRGILTKEDLNGIELNWGDAEAFATLSKMIAERKGIGDLLAEGAYRAALKIGETKNMNILPYAVAIKGMGIGAHGMRSRKDFPNYESYPCSVQGADHTSIAHLPINDTESELRVILFDSGVFCWFNFLEAKPYDLLWELIESVTGWKITPDEWYGTISRRIINIQRAVLLLGGPDLKWIPGADDTIPQRWQEPLREGPYSGKFIEIEKVEKAKKEYYKAIGWDEMGVPKTEELHRLGLDDVDERMQELRSR